MEEEKERHKRNKVDRALDNQEESVDQRCKNRHKNKQMYKHKKQNKTKKSHTWKTETQFGLMPLFLDRN